MHNEFPYSRTPPEWVVSQKTIRPHFNYLMNNKKLPCKTVVEAVDQWEVFFPKPINKACECQACSLWCNIYNPIQKFLRYIIKERTKEKKNLAWNSNVANLEMEEFIKL